MVHGQGSRLHRRLRLRGRAAQQHAPRRSAPWPRVPRRACIGLIHVQEIADLQGKSDIAAFVVARGPAVHPDFGPVIDGLKTQAHGLAVPCCGQIESLAIPGHAFVVLPEFLQTGRYRNLFDVVVGVGRHPRRRWPDCKNSRVSSVQVVERPARSWLHSPWPSQGVPRVGRLHARVGGPGRLHQDGSGTVTPAPQSPLARGSVARRGAIGRRACAQCHTPAAG